MFLQPQAQNMTMSLFVYMVLDPEGQGQISAELSGDRVTGIRGRTPELGEFTLNFPKPDKLFKANYLVGYSSGLDTLTQTMSQAFNYYTSTAGAGKASGPEVRYIGLAGQVLPDGVSISRANFIVAQYTVDIPFEVQMAFESGSFVSRPDHLLGDTYQASLSDHLTKFDRRFEEAFGLAAKGYDRDRVTFAKAVLSNMIGGIGYFYGSSLVKSVHASFPLNYWPAALYTAVPSRSFFPRGFLWDEGFHNILINEWNPELSMDIIGHWLDLLNADGWIPREQILGAEARAKVPAEFVVQSNENANPPTLFLPLRAIVSRLSPTDVRGHEYLKKLFPRLQAWYGWYNLTQSGSIGGTYRWRGRNATGVYELNPKTLTSGLDDYPRASHPSDEERHVDLRCWMALASGVMADVARAVNESWEDYERTRAMLVDNEHLDALHWSERSQSYADYGLHTDRVKLERPTAPVKNLQMGQRPPQHQPPRQLERVVKTPPSLQLVDSEFGYVSLFPFLLRIVDAGSPKLGKILVDLKNEKLLWTPYGLRSLAKSAPSYGKHNTEHDPPYWRGAIWINVNYLALGALNHYASAPGPHRETASLVYTELRENVVENLYQQYRLSGYLWEQYDDTTGKGKGSHPFTGWSALVVSIMSEHYY